MRSEIFEKLSLPRLFARCVLPGSVSMAAGALYVVVDGMFVGHYMGHDSLAAANMMWPLLGVVFALSSMVSTGASVKISNYLGRREREKACRMFTTSVCIEIALGLFMCVAGFLLTVPFLKLMGAGAQTQELCRSYIRSYLVFGPLVCLYYSINGYLRVSGMQRFSMWLNVGASLLNLLLDYIFIVVLRQGIWCASFTTCVSLSAGAVAESKIVGGESVMVVTNEVNVAFSYSQNWPMGAAFAVTLTFIIGALTIYAFRKIDLDKILGRA